MLQVLINRMNCTNEDMDSPGRLDVFFTSIGILVTGFFVGFVAVATLVYSPPKKEPKIPYEQQFYDDFCELIDRELDDDETAKLKETYLRETTPNGDVIICYNKDHDSFDVWHDDRNIPFMILDAVAQQYAIKHDTKSICVNYKEEYDLAILKMKSMQESNDDSKEQEPVVKKEDDVFATFKSYNTASEKGKTTENKIITEKCNHFRRVGNIKDWEDKEVPSEEPKEAKMSYDEFKVFMQMCQQLKPLIPPSDDDDSEGEKKEK